MRSTASRFVAGLAVPAILAAACAPAPPAIPASPLAAIDELLAADRGFGAAARTLDGVEALAATFDDGIILPAQARFAEGKAAAVAALRENPQNAASRLEWSPIRGGISADGHSTGSPTAS